MVELDGHVAFQRDALSLDYPGATRFLRDSNGLARQEIRLYNAYASAIPAGQPCLIRYDGDEETNPYVISGAASGTAIIERLVVPQASVAASSFGWFAFAGYASVLTVGTADIAKDDFLQLVVGTTGGLVVDAATMASTSCAISTAANALDTTPTSVIVFLINEKFSIDQT